MLDGFVCILSISVAGRLLGNNQPEDTPPIFLNTTLGCGNDSCAVLYYHHFSLVIIDNYAKV